MSLQGKVALIIGASQTPGSDVALALAREGVKVAVEGVAGVQERVLRTVETFGGDALPVRGDVLDESDINHMLSNIEAILGPVDILVNASGLTLGKSLEDSGVSEWEQVVISKAKTAFICSRAVVPGMKERGAGHVISIVSPCGPPGGSNQTAEIASEQALAGFTQALAGEVRDSGVRVSRLLTGASDSAEVAQGVVLLASQTGSSTDSQLIVGS
jgi:3-oxoacyl-[acyl-carrier protein] reductase